jgi:hypothetical protein
MEKDSVFRAKGAKLPGTENRLGLSPNKTIKRKLIAAF